MSAKKTSVKTCLRKLNREFGNRGLARRLGIAYQSINQWHSKNRLPRTEYTGETFYALEIQRMTNGKIKIEDLLGFIPQPQQWKMDEDEAA